jgi:hypothetical protein
MNQLKSLAENMGLMPIDLVRAAVKGLLSASKSNNGKVELPLHVRTKKEEAAWAYVCNAVTAIDCDSDAEDIEKSFLNLVATADSYALAAGLSETVEHVADKFSHDSATGQTTRTTTIIGGTAAGKNALPKKQADELIDASRVASTVAKKKPTK